jgi:3-oxoadipate enol-lactonase
LPTTHANGIDIWYELRGSGPTLALSHGWRGPTVDWPPGLLDELAKHVRLLVYDVRGHGQTTAPERAEDYSMPAYAQDLCALLDALDIDRTHIGGVSQGGMISAQFAVDFPERTRSVLICDSTAGNGADEGPGGNWERAMQRYTLIIQEKARAEGQDALAEWIVELDRKDTHYLEHPVDVADREAKARLQNTRMPLEALCGTAEAMRARPDLTARLKDVRVPALVLAGEWDGFMSCSERDHKLLEGSRLVRVSRCGHASPDWRPDAFLKAVSEFIADVEAGRDVAGEMEL